MAKRKRARRTSSRRRRRSARKQRRFAAVRAYLPNPRRRRRRHYRRNPVFGGGLVTTLKNGVKDGLIVLGAQAATRRVMVFVGGFNPLKGIPGVAVTGLGTAVAVSLLAKKMLPRQAGLISAAAFAEGLRGVIAATPAAPLFADYITDTQQIGEWTSDEGYGAWPQIPASVAASGMGAWPQFGGVNDQEEMMQ